MAKFTSRIIFSIGKAAEKMSRSAYAALEADKFAEMAQNEARLSLSFLKETGEADAVGVAELALKRAEDAAQMAADVARKAWSAERAWLTALEVILDAALKEEGLISDKNSEASNEK